MFLDYEKWWSIQPKCGLALIITKNDIGVVKNIKDIKNMAIIKTVDDHTAVKKKTRYLKAFVIIIPKLNLSIITPQSGIKTSF